MCRVQVDGNPVRLHQLHEVIGNLLADALLHGEPPGEQPDQPGQLRDSDDVLVRDVSDVGDAVERQRVVLTEGEERDRPFDDLADPAVRTTAALGGKGGEQLVIYFVAAAGKRL